MGRVVSYRTTLGLRLFSKSLLVRHVGGVANNLHQLHHAAVFVFQEVAMQKVVLNQKAANTLGIVFPPEVIKAAAQA